LIPRQAPYWVLYIAIFKVDIKGSYVSPYHTVPELETEGVSRTVEDLTDELGPVVRVTRRAGLNIQITTCREENKQINYTCNLRVSALINKINIVKALKMAHLY